MFSARNGNSQDSHQTTSSNTSNDCTHVPTTGVAQSVEELTSQNQALILRLESTEEELKATRSQLAQAGKLATLGTMGASIAHELNNPLTVIGAESDELLDLLTGDCLTGEQLRYSVQNIKRCAERMRTVVDHIRRYSRDEKDASWHRVDVNQVIRDALIILQRPLETSGISVTIDLCQDLPMIWGDAGKLESVFQNIISNARDAFESVGDSRKKSIVISTHSAAQALIEVRIKDNGPGMTEEVRKGLFKPFFTTKEPGKGTGLGLSIAQTIVNEHRGDITVDSHLGDGTEFVLTFPVERRNRAVNIVEG